MEDILTILAQKKFWIKLDAKKPLYLFFSFDNMVVAWLINQVKSHGQRRQDANLEPYFWEQRV